MKSFDSVLAFPGGKEEHVKDKQICETFNKSKQILNNSDISIATALRECFQETGLYIPQHPIFESQKIQDLNQIKLEYIAATFINTNKELAQGQNETNENFLFETFKRIMDVCPLRSDLLPFVRLITIPSLPSRFDTSFYLHKIQDFKLLNFFKFAQNEKHIHNNNDIFMNRQFNSFSWWNPLEVIQSYVDKKIKLAPPQFIMLNIMSNFYRYQELQQFIKLCKNNEINIGPNIISVIKNQGYFQEDFPSVATLIGDTQFPFDFNLENEKDERIRESLSYLQNKFANKEDRQKVRILFKKPLQFLEDYESQCTVESSILNKFMNSKQLRNLLQKVM